MKYTLQQISEKLNRHEETIKRYRYLYGLGYIGNEYGRVELLFTEDDVDFIKNEIIYDSERSAGKDITVTALIKCIKTHPGRKIHEYAKLLGHSDSVIINRLCKIRFSHIDLCEEDDGRLYWKTEEFIKEWEREHADEG